MSSAPWRAAGRRGRAPELAGVRAFASAALCVVAWLGARPPTRPPDLAPVVDRAGTCALAPERGGPACPCPHLPARLRLVLGLPLALNGAARPELELLPGIGPRRAEAIVRERSSAGPFAHPGELVRVPGIGSGGARALAGHLFAGRDPCLDRRQGVRTPASPGGGARFPFWGTAVHPARPGGAPALR